MKEFVETENKVIKDIISQGSTDFQKLEARIDQESADHQKLVDRIDQESNELKKLQTRIDGDLIDCQRLEKETADLKLKLTDVLKQAQSESQALRDKLSDDEMTRQQKDREISVRYISV